MSNLMNVKTKNGSLANNDTNTLPSFPTWSSWIDDIFNRDMPSVFSSNYNTGITLPKVNIKETADAYAVEMAVPGMKKSDFQIDLDNNTLCISSATETENTEEDSSYTRREYGYSSFKRTFSLPETVDEEKISAKYNDGILSVYLPKKEEAKQKPPRNIEIS